VISTTVITYNRLEYTKKTIQSYLENTSVPHELIVVDNASEDGTQKYLKHLKKKDKAHKIILNKKNRFPGYATNQGWDAASPKTKFLHRSDNDLLYKPGWDKEAIQVFKDFPKAGQVGLINELYQLPPSQHDEYLKKKITKGKSTVLPPLSHLGNVGGPCLVPYKIFKKGVRWSDDQWRTGINEDYKFSKAMKDAGYEVYELVSKKVTHFGHGDIQKYYNYYFWTYWKRNALQWFSERLKLEQAGKIKNGQTID